MISRFSSARSSFVCSPVGMSPISSRNTVPPAADSSSPGLVCVAPVKAPRSCPNSSLSSSDSEMAAQLMHTRGPPARGECRWIQSASTSLPTPVSPRMSTLMRPLAVRPARGALRQAIEAAHRLRLEHRTAAAVGVGTAQQRAGAADQRFRRTAVAGVGGDRGVNGEPRARAPAGPRRPRSFARAPGRCRAAALRSRRARTGRGDRPRAARPRPGRRPRRRAPRFRSARGSPPASRRFRGRGRRRPPAAPRTRRDPGSAGAAGRRGGAGS